MFRRFFVPLDGSSRAEKAIPVAAALARASSGSLILARVMVPPTHEEYGANFISNETRLIQAEEQAKAQVYLNEVLEKYDQILSGLHLILEAVPETGTVAGTLLSLAEQEHSDLIVMCSRGDHLLKRWVFGSVAQSTMRRSPLPVLALNEHDTTGVLEQISHPLRLLIPLDGSAFSEALLSPLCQLLALFPASQPHELHLLQVVTVPPAFGRFQHGAYVSDTLQHDEVQSAEHYLATVEQKLSQQEGATATFTVTTEVILSADVAGTIVQLAREGAQATGAPYDLIALATHGRSGFKRAFMGSVTEHVFGATALPLFVICPPALDTEARTADQKSPHTFDTPISQGPVGLL